MLNILGITGNEMHFCFSWDVFFNTANRSIHLLSVWSGARDQISLGLGFPICNMKRLGFTRGGSVLRWKCKLFHLFCLIKHFQIMTNLWPKLLLLICWCCLTLTFQHGLVHPSFFILSFSPAGPASKLPQIPRTWGVRLALINRGNCGFREGVSPLPGVCTVKRSLRQGRMWKGGGFILLELMGRPRLWTWSDLGLTPHSAIYCVTSNLNLFLT